MPWSWAARRGWALQSWSARDDEIVSKALRCVGMHDRQQRLWGQLSGGERQRIHIARALAQQPQILLMDEPTNHLDIHQQLALMDLVLALPITKVMAIHDLNQAMRCDRLAVMHQGRLHAIGKPAAILQAPLLKEIFQVRATELFDPALRGSPSCCGTCLRFSGPFSETLPSAPPQRPFTAAFHCGPSQRPFSAPLF